MKHKEHIRFILANAPAECKLFTNPTGRFRAAHGGFVMAGLGKGTSDIIGWTHIRGRGAVFTAIECKDAKERVSEAQEAFIAEVNKAGGIGIISRDGVECVNELRQELR